MQLKDWLDARRLRRALINNGRFAADCPIDASATGTLRKAGALATLVVAAGLAIATSRFMVARAEPRRVLREFQTSQDCAARYAALLDLAELARHDGKASEVVMRGLSARNGAMSACLQRVSAAPDDPGAHDEKESVKANAPDS